MLNELFIKLPILDDGFNIVKCPAVEYENRSVYFGEWNLDTDQRHGRGIQCWIDGSRYEGYWKFDRANLRGILYHADGDMYDGEWVNDKAEGIGKYIHIDGAVYEGSWKDDKQDGEGIFFLKK